MHSYLHNIKTFNNATMHLTHVERSLYRCLIEMYYDTEQPLTADNFDRLAKRVLAHSDEEKAALRYVLDEFFELTGDVYTHDYCDQVIDEYKRLQTAKAKAGKASVEARRLKAEQRKQQRKAEAEQKRTGVEQTLNTCSTGVRNHKPLTINHNISSAGPENNKPPDSDVKKIAASPCPHTEIIDLYHRVLPELPRVVGSRWSGSSRERELRTRWKESQNHQTLEFWEKFFTAIRKIDWYFPGQGGPQIQDFSADLGWLIKRKNFDKTIERLTNMKQQDGA